MSRKALIILLAVLACLLTFTVYLLRLPQLPDDLNQIALSRPSRILDADGVLVRVLADREVVPLSEISPVFIQAVLALEDHSFYRHHGFSKRSFVRALLSDLRHGRFREGGSTITQQLAKNLFFSFEKRLVRKIDELLITFQIERQFSKDAILEAYVNQIPFGPVIYGVEKAAATYFAKGADELSLAEAAMLAGIPRNPPRYNPYRDLAVARERMSFVLHRMAEQGYITQEQQQAALSDTLELRQLNPMTGAADYFIDAIVGQIGEKYGRKAVRYGGLDIYTTLKADEQVAARRAVEQELAGLDEQLGLPPYKEASWEDRLSYPQAALVAVDVRSGAVRALEGGRDPRRAPFNRALAGNRQAGSAFKPFIYLAALKQGAVGPSTVMIDEPLILDSTQQPWPENFESEYYGNVTVKYALAHSINTIAAKLIDKITPAAVIETARQFGITSPLEEHLSLALGTAGVSPLEMAVAYATLPGGGVRREAHFYTRLTAWDGTTIDLRQPHSTRVYDPQTCYLVLDMLRGVIDFGTGKSVRRLGFRHPCAGKTGTTDDGRDAWFIGFTPQRSVAVWVGYDDNRPMVDRWGVEMTGARAALPIWTRFMKLITANEEARDFTIPPGIEFIEIDPRTGAGPFPGGEKITVAVKAGQF